MDTAPRSIEERGVSSADVATAPSVRERNTRDENAGKRKENDRKGVEIAPGYWIDVTDAPSSPPRNRRNAVAGLR